MKIRHFLIVAVVAAIAQASTKFELFAAPPAGYYDSVDATNEATLRATLHEVIDDHTRFPYTSGSTDTWDILELAQQDPNNSNNVIDVYRNRSYGKIGGGTGPYNREHSWPKSYGFPDDGGSNYPYTDCYQLYLCDSGYNSERSNKLFDSCSGSCAEEPTDNNLGQGGGSGPYPGNSNWTSGSFTDGTWEVWIGRRGDIARAMFYMDVRYEGGTHGVTGANEPDLILTDNQSLIDSSNTGNNLSVAYMGKLSILLQWHAEDPVDDWERNRNDVVSSFQGNRNPFIDHPEWVSCVFQSNCSNNPDPAPAAPVGLMATAGDTQVSLDWNDNSDADLLGYNVYRALAGSGSFVKLTPTPILISAFDDNSVVNDTAYDYRVTAVDLASQESAPSVTVSATPSANQVDPSGDPWINEFHYDNSGGDTGEFFEIAGPAGLDLSGWSVVGYNGNGGVVYATISLSGIIPEQDGCMGTLAFDMVGMQNGSPDGIALVDPSNNVLEFISYEGAFTASGGPADGMTSIDIGVAEEPAPPAGESLQLSGNGASAADFTWQSSNLATRGQANNNQTLDGCQQQDTTPPDAPTGLVAIAAPGVIQLNWIDNNEPDLAGYNVFRSTSASGPYSQIDGTIIGSDYIDSGVIPCNEYFYVVTAVDISTNESDDSNSATAFGTSVGTPIEDCNANQTPDECDADGDDDGTIDDCDGCPADPQKTSPGTCGCGVIDTTPDGDMNVDGYVNGVDVQLFVTALLDGGDTAAVCHGDFNANASVELGDLEQFVSEVIGQ